MNKIYVFLADTDSRVYASKIINSENYFCNCSQCGSVYLKKMLREVDLLINGKGKLPDILVCGHWPMLLVSDKVYATWIDNNISGITRYPVRLYRKNGARLRLLEDVYHNIVITGRCRLDLSKMGVEIVNICSDCGIVKYNKEIWEFGEPVIIEGSWGGSDLFACEYFENTALCTTKNLELIHRNKLTNFSITRFEDMFDFSTEDLIITDELSIN